jgi:hypothetical protein
MTVKPFALVGLCVVSLVTAACGGGGGNAVPPPAASTAAPTSAPTTSGAQSLPVSGGGVSGLLTITAAGATLASSAATTNPSATSTLALRRSSTVATGAALLYVTVTASASTTITAIGGSFTLSTAPSQAVHLGYWTGSAWDDLGAATVSGTTVTFAPTTLNPSIAANPNAYFVLYASTTALPTASPSPSPSPSPSSSPSPSPTSSATSGLSFVDTACAQAPATQDGTLTSVASSFFSTIVPNAKTICLSAWDLSSDIDTALIAAAHNGASVTVITPLSQNSSNSSDIAAIVAAGGHAKYEYTSSPGTPTASIAYQQAPFDIHAKFALVDGVAYMDGHNWFTTDVVMRDGIAGDFAAIQADLTTFATPAPSNGTFTTDKQVSLKNESAYLQSVIPNLASGNEYDFITESFNPNGDGEYNDDVYDGMCQIAALPAHVTMHVMVEEFSGYSTSAKSALQNLLLLDPNASVHTDNNGHEKISMIRSTVGGAPTSAWFGSSNATTTDLFDWGMNISDPGMLTALQSYFDGVFNAASSIPTPSPGVTAAPCATPHA